MMELGIFFSKFQAEEVVEGLLALPGQLRPTHYSPDEKLKSKKDVVTDKARFKEFRDGNPLGFFLMRKEISYDLSLHIEGSASLHAYSERPLSADDVETIFRTLVAAAPIFGYVADSWEYKHRNYMITRLPQFTVEGNVGRDLSKYLPGLYWVTLLSSAYCKTHGIPLDELCRDSQGTMTDLSEDLHMLRMPYKPSDWSLHADRIDGLCEQYDGIFSIRKVRHQAEKTTDYKELSAFLKNWT